MLKLTVKVFVVISMASMLSPMVSAQLGNTNESFNKAKKILLRQVYYDHHTTLYCGAKFDDKKRVIPLPGFITTKHKKRAHRIEWEHVVPAENFGRTFAEWRDGHPRCIGKRGPFKGRSCASKINPEYRRMQADMYNLYPAIGAVNALRSNYNFSPLPGEPSDFGSCPMKIANRKVDPPEYARGRIARTYLYFEQTYPRFKMSKQQRKLMNAWNTQYPVTQWECTRTKRIEHIQRNDNSVVKIPCQNHGWW